MHDDDPETTFTYVIEKLNRYGLAYLHIVNPALAATGEDVVFTERAKRMNEMIRRTYRGVLMVAGGFDGSSAERWLEGGNADLIAFGRLFIANPDLPERFWSHAPLNSPGPNVEIYRDQGLEAVRPQSNCGEHEASRGASAPFPCVDNAVPRSRSRHVHSQGRMELKAALRNNSTGEGKKCTSARFTMDQSVWRRAQPACAR